jgi:hypothetical protein
MTADSKSGRHNGERRRIHSHIWYAFKLISLSSHPYHPIGHEA